MRVCAECSERGDREGKEKPVNNGPFLSARSVGGPLSPFQMWLTLYGGPFHPIVKLLIEGVVSKLLGTEDDMHQI